MEQVAEKKSLLLLGSTGFLGSAVMERLKSEHLEDWQILISRSSSLENSIPFILLNSDFEPGTTFDYLNFSDLQNKYLIVINCASSRNSRNEESSQQGNFEYPKKVLELLVNARDLRIRWIQIETYWQYSKASIPDASYVLWKNRFSALLTESSRNENLVIEKLALPHLIGPFDDLSRFLPRLFSKLFRNESTIVNSPDEGFYLADVRDVANYLIRTLNDIKANQDLAARLFPFYELPLREIVQRFVTTLKSESSLKFEGATRNSNPILIPTEQPPMLESSHQRLRSLESTFSDIAQWLSGLQRVDNLQ